MGSCYREEMIKLSLGFYYYRSNLITLYKGHHLHVYIHSYWNNTAHSSIYTCMALQVKHQHSCGSSWAFASTGALEAQHKRITNELAYMSEQQLIDCSWAYGNRGCSGGHANYAFQYISQCDGLCTRDSYPYLGYVSDS